MNALEKSAQAWCTEKTSNKEMDVELAKAFADILNDCLRTLAKVYAETVNCDFCPIQKECKANQDEWRCSEILINYAIEHPTEEE